MYSRPNPSFNGPYWLLVVGLADGVWENNPTLDDVVNGSFMGGREWKELKVKKRW
jgi:hypothetical protein